MTFFTRPDDPYEIHAVITCCDIALDCGIIALKKEYKHSKKSLRHMAVLDRVIEGVFIELRWNELKDSLFNRIGNFFYYLNKPMIPVNMTIFAETGRKLGRWLTSDCLVAATKRDSNFCVIDNLVFEKVDSLFPTDTLFPKEITFHQLLPKSFFEKVGFCFSHFIKGEELWVSLYLENEHRHRLALFLLSEDN